MNAASSGTVSHLDDGRQPGAVDKLITDIIAAVQPFEYGGDDSSEFRYLLRDRLHELGEELEKITTEDEEDESEGADDAPESS